MVLREMIERKVSSGPSAPDRPRGIRPDRRKPGRAASWPQRLIERIKRGERFQACAYFVNTIL